MPVVSYDGQSVILDGKRVFLVSGSIHYARLPEGSWESRVADAAQAGLNCIESPVVWAGHEPQPDEYCFEGRYNLRQFIEWIQKYQLYCILRIGPFVGDGYDFGGLPAWLLNRPDSQEVEGPGLVRQADPSFLQAAARYFDAAFSQLHELQASESAQGPILAVQLEHHWFCHHPDGADAYFEPLTRYLRESHCTVPVLTRNNLWHRVGGAIETWHGGEEPLTTARQLNALHGDAPPIIHLPTLSQPSLWGEPIPRPIDPDELMRSFTRAVAGGAMVNLDPFCGGVNLAFDTGRIHDPAGFYTSDAFAAAPIAACGLRNPTYAPIKRLATFLRSFNELVAHWKQDEKQTVAATGLSVVQRTGSQGSVIFVVRDEKMPQSVELSTPGGLSLPIDFGEEAAAWCLLDTQLAPLTRLDATNLRPWAMVGGRLLVLYGPSGSKGILSINGELESIRVRQFAGKSKSRQPNPKILRYEDITIAVLSTDEIDATCIDEDGIWIGVERLKRSGAPVPHPHFASFLRVSCDGEMTKQTLTRKRRPPLPKLSPWLRAGLEDYVRGDAAQFATLPGARSLPECGAGKGYGWYAVTLHRSHAGNVNWMMPESADRIHLYLNGKLKTILGEGPGAKPSHNPISLSLPSGETKIVFLADSLGRDSDAFEIDRPGGIWGEILDVTPLSLAAPNVTQEPRADPFELSDFVPGVSVDAHGTYPRYTFEMKLPSTPQVVLSLTGKQPRPRSVILLNSQPVAIDSGDRDLLRVFGAPLRKGVNRITFALLDEDETDEYPVSSISLHRVTDILSESATWYYAKWRLPDESDFEPMDKESSTGSAPAFFRATFEVNTTDEAMKLKLSGCTKGQIFLNGRNVGRYWIATSTRKKVPPQTEYDLPASWLQTKGANELILFDEHGKPPSRAKIVYA